MLVSLGLAHVRQTQAVAPQDFSRLQNSSTNRTVLLLDTRMPGSLPYVAQRAVEYGQWMVEKKEDPSLCLQRVAHRVQAAQYALAHAQSERAIQTFYKALGYLSEAKGHCHTSQCQGEFTQAKAEFIAVLESEMDTPDEVVRQHLADTLAKVEVL